MHQNFASPATISQQIVKKLTDLLSLSHHHISVNSPKFTQLTDDLNKLGKVDAAHRSVLMSGLYSIAGDREQAEYYIRNSEKIHAKKIEIELARLTMLLILGYFSESIKVVELLGDPQLGQLSTFLHRPPSNGCFHLLKSFYDKATTMNLSNISGLPNEHAAAVRIMDSWGDTDIDYAKALDVAGSILRNRKLFYIERLFTNVVEAPRDGSSPYVKLAFKVDVDLETSIDMTCEYSEKLAGSGVKIPPSMIFEFLPVTE